VGALRTEPTLFSVTLQSDLNWRYRGDDQGSKHIVPNTRARISFDNSAGARRGSCSLQKRRSYELRAMIPDADDGCLQRLIRQSLGWILDVACARIAQRKRGSSAAA
jgi:hypothetical protein